MLNDVWMVIVSWILIVYLFVFSGIPLPLQERECYGKITYLLRLELFWPGTQFTGVYDPLDFRLGLPSVYRSYEHTVCILCGILPQSFSILF